MGRVLTVLLLAPAALTAAPVPPRPAAPAPTAADLVGAWAYEWGCMGVGGIELFADGTFASHHGTDARYAGAWAFDGAALTLWERRLTADGTAAGCAAYVVPLARTPGGWAGACGGTPVRLTGGP